MATVRWTEVRSPPVAGGRERPSRGDGIAALVRPLTSLDDMGSPCSWKAPEGGRRSLGRAVGGPALSKAQTTFPPSAWDALGCGASRSHSTAGEGVASTADSGDSIQQGRSCVISDGGAMASSIRWFRMKDTGHRRSGAARGRADATRFWGSATVTNVTPGTSPNPEHDSADSRQVIPNVFCRCCAQPIVPALLIALVGHVTAEPSSCRRAAHFRLIARAQRSVGDWFGGRRSAECSRRLALRRH
jgi:hypothetical protein